jgi:outer membrane protein W
MSLFKPLIACVLIVLPVSASAQPATDAEKPKRSLRGKHRIELGIGLLTELRNATEITIAGVTTQSNASGALGFISYTYYFDNSFGFTIGAGVLDADATTSVSGTGAAVESASVVPLLFGVKFQPEKLAAGNALRPYASAAIGPYFGSASNVRAGVTTSTENVSEAVLGARLGIGVDFFLGRLFTFGVGIGYHFVSDFENRIGSESDYSSPEFSLSLGVAFGG